MSDPVTRLVDVLIVGCGPSGAVLAHLLAQAGLKVCVLEREPEVYPFCRATHLDAETLRHFQLTGLMPLLRPYFSPFGAVDVYDARGRKLLSETLTAGSQHGYPGSVVFEQPSFERVLRQGFELYPQLELVTGYAACTLSQDQTAVRLTARHTASGDLREFQSRWLVGCDGGRSAIRAALGVDMQRLNEPRNWLIVDTRLRHPKDLSALPESFRYLLHKRLTIYAHGFGLNRRWEFQLEPGESAPDESVVMDWLRPFIDPERLEILRIGTYAHLALIARQWRVGRVLLAGDAAHMMPPTAGQGLCSGLRDVVSLAWRLERVLKDPEGPDWLAGYELERKPHVQAVLAGALFLARRLRADQPAEVCLRHLSLSLIGRLPWLQAIMRRCGLKAPDRSRRHIPQFWEGEQGSDQQLGYRWTLLCRTDDVLSSETRMRCQRLGITLLSLSELVPWSQPFSEWLGPADFALIRPDKISVAQGRFKTLGDVLNRFSQL